ncbi:MAG: hypothetical protein NT077_00500, partial [Candidatus Taylorbacteria bacterium]|nr:hypothetical protein [Candidatus Taylorbacteria bacterium]
LPFGGDLGGDFIHADTDGKSDVEGTIQLVLNSVGELLIRQASQLERPIGTVSEPSNIGETFVYGIFLDFPGVAPDDGVHALGVLGVHAIVGRQYDNVGTYAAYLAQAHASNDALGFGFW